MTLLILFIHIWTGVLLLNNHRYLFAYHVIWNVVVFHRYILNKKCDEDDPNIDKWLEWESVQLQVMSCHWSPGGASNLCQGDMLMSTRCDCDIVLRCHIYVKLKSNTCICLSLRCNHLKPVNFLNYIN